MEARRDLPFCLEAQPANCYVQQMHARRADALGVRGGMGATYPRCLALALVAHGLLGCYAGGSRDTTFLASGKGGDAMADDAATRCANTDCDTFGSSLRDAATNVEGGSPAERVGQVSESPPDESPADPTEAAAPDAIVVADVPFVDPGAQDAGTDAGPPASPDDAAANDVSTWCDESCPGLLDLQGGREFTCALFEGGLVKCWGRDDRGQLGRASEGAHQMLPSEVEPIDFGTERRVVQLSAGGNHACVRFEDNRARCWGANEAGQLGIGSNKDYSDQPQERLADLPDLDLNDVVDIAAGTQHTCALRMPEDAPPSVHCFGVNDSGESGLGEDDTWGIDSPIDDSRPVDLGEAVPISVHAAGNASCARLAEGGIRCWGYSVLTGRPAGSNNRLPPNTDDYNPIKELWLNSVAGDSGSWCGWTEVDLRCWGDASDGRFGIPEDWPGLVRESLLEPMTIDIGGLEFTQMVYGKKTGCLLSEGRVYCFGAASRAGYGGAFDTALTPAENWALLPQAGAVDFGDADGADGLDPITRVFAATTTYCAQTTGGDLRCFGRNDWGQLGYGFAEDDGSELGSSVGIIGDDETPAQAYEVMGMHAVPLW